MHKFVGGLAVIHSTISYDKIIHRMDKFHPKSVDQFGFMACIFSLYENVYTPRGWNENLFQTYYIIHAIIIYLINAQIL